MKYGEPGTPVEMDIILPPDEANAEYSFTVKVYASISECAQYLEYVDARLRANEAKQILSKNC